MKKETKLVAPSVLAFERKLSPSDALMSAGKWNDRDNAEQWKHLTVCEKAIRGTISNRASRKNEEKMKADISSANLQRVDVVMLPFDCDTLNVSFSLRVLGNLKDPSACNDSEYQVALQQMIEGYIEEFQFKELSERYAENLANGRFLWRNRVGADSVEVQVKAVKDGLVCNSWTFDALKYDVKTFSKSEEILSLAQEIQNGLLGTKNVILKVSAFARLGEGQEVFPSQELVLEQSSQKGAKSKYLYSFNGKAAMHSQKIGNAIRTIDSWYSEAEKFGPIAVEPYGAVTSRSENYRKPSEKVDFYSLLDKWVVDSTALTEDQMHFVIATLIRGGVFSNGAKEK